MKTSNVLVNGWNVRVDWDVETQLIELRINRPALSWFPPVAVTIPPDAIAWLVTLLQKLRADGIIPPVEGP